MSTARFAYPGRVEKRGGSRTRSTFAAIVFVVFWELCFSIRGAQAIEAKRFLADHLTLELAAVGSWRSSWAEERNPGFHVGGGGAELNFGLELDNGFGVLIGGRALFGRHIGQDEQLSGLFTEASGQAIAQLRVSDWVRVGLGATGGRLWRCCGPEVESPPTSELLFGGFLRVSVDYLPRTSLPRALSIWLRLGIDGSRPDDALSLLPAVSMNMAVGMGIRL
jgi:hypothetical protein